MHYNLLSKDFLYFLMVLSILSVFNPFIENIGIFPACSAWDEQHYLLCRHWAVTCTQPSRDSCCSPSILQTSLNAAGMDPRFQKCTFFIDWSTFFIGQFSIFMLSATLIPSASFYPRNLLCLI